MVKYRLEKKNKTPTTIYIFLKNKFLYLLRFTSFQFNILNSKSYIFLPIQNNNEMVFNLNQPMK